MRILRCDVHNFANTVRLKSAEKQNKTHAVVSYNVGQKVYLQNEVIHVNECRKTARRFIGPYVILSKSAYNTYKLSHVYTGKVLQSMVHADKLRPSHTARKTRKNLTDSENELPDEEPDDDDSPTDGVTGQSDSGLGSQNPLTHTAVIAKTDTVTVNATAHGKDSTDWQEIAFTGTVDSANETCHGYDDWKYATGAYSFQKEFCGDILGDENPPFAIHINHLHARAQEMRRVLRIRRVNGCSIACVKLFDGDTINVRLVKVPCKLIAKYRLERYRKAKHD